MRAIVDEAAAVDIRCTETASTFCKLDRGVLMPWAVDSRKSGGLPNLKRLAILDSDDLAGH